MRTKIGANSYVTKGCPKHNREVLGRVFPQPRRFKHFVRCCKDKSGPVDEDCVSRPCPAGAVTYNEAVEICKNRGRHLCINALNQPDNCCGTGCNYDVEWIWVGDPGITSPINIKTY